MLHFLLLFIYFIPLTLQKEFINTYDNNNNFTGTTLFCSNTNKRFNFLCFLLFYQVILNLIDIPQLVYHGWIPVLYKSNTTLTQNFMSTLDIIPMNSSFVNNAAIRAPFSLKYQRATLLHINPNRKFTEILSMQHLLFIYFLILSFCIGSNVSETVILLGKYRSVKNSSGILFSLLNDKLSTMFGIKISENITLTYRYKNQLEQIIFHHKRFIANDGL